jgi:hypothetical protein
MSDKVITQGKEGWVFLTGGSNKVLDIYSGLKVNEGWEKKWAQVIISRAERFNSKNIQYCHVSAPEKIGVYGQYMPDDQRIDFANSPSILLGAALENKNCDSYVNPIHYLKQQSKKYKVYHQTDSHWTFTGAYCAYQLIMAKLGLSPNNEVIGRKKKMVSCIMDLAGKLETPIAEVVSFHKLAKTVSRVEINSLVKYKESNNLDNDAGLHVGCSVTFKNNQPKHHKRVLVFGDSFSEYRPHLLTGILAETFSEVKFVWGSSIDKNIVNEFNPDIIITETAERFMPFNVPLDDFDYAEFATKKIESLSS